MNGTKRATGEKSVKTPSGVLLLTLPLLVGLLVLPVMLHVYGHSLRYFLPACRKEIVCFFPPAVKKPRLVVPSRLPALTDGRARLCLIASSQAVTTNIPELARLPERASLRLVPTGSHPRKLGKTGHNLCGVISCNIISYHIKVQCGKSRETVGAAERPECCYYHNSLNDNDDYDNK